MFALSWFTLLHATICESIKGLDKAQFKDHLDKSCDGICLSFLEIISNDLLLNDLIE